MDKEFIQVQTIRNDIEKLEKQLELAKYEEQDAVKYVYDDLMKIASKTDSNFYRGYIASKRKLPGVMPALVRDNNILCYGDDFPKGDVIFTDDKIYLFMQWFTLDFMEKLKEKYTDKIRIRQGKPIEVELDMSWCLK